MYDPLINAVWIGLWAWLFCGPLSQAGEAFGWLSNWLYVNVKVNSRLSEAASDAWMKVLIDCPKCHAGQIAFWWQVWEVCHGRGFSIPFILLAIFAAITLENIAQLIDKAKNA